MKNCTTRHELRNGSFYPCVTIDWKYDDRWAAGGWDGTLTLWRSEKEKDPRPHTVSIGQGCPLGQVTVQFDDFGHGCWKMASFDGVGVTERDLQWATLWAVLALESRRSMGDLQPIPS